MLGDLYAQKVNALLGKANITPGGIEPFDPQIHNPLFYQRLLGQGSLGLGESYMQGWWDVDQLDEFFYRVIQAKLPSQVTTLRDKLFYAVAHLINRQRRFSANEVNLRHYNIGNNLYQQMLDSRMIYSCAYWRDADSLEQAQEHKLDLIAKKLGFEPGMRVLDIGCGWGGSAIYLADKYGVQVLGISNSSEQIKWAKERNQSANTVFKLIDYRDLEGKFDRVYSIGMFEHVGFKNYATYFKKISDALHSEGLALLHTIGFHITSYRVDPWIEKYIFPNGILPSRELIESNSHKHFDILDWHEFGLDYHRTLHEWNLRIEERWDSLPEYNTEFRRMWHYYLMCCAGAFKARTNELWQIVLAKKGATAPTKQDYSPIRSAL